VSYIELQFFFLLDILQELCSSLIYHLGKIKAQSEAFSVYNMLRFGKRTMCKALHEKILHILIAGMLLKDAYVVVKVCYVGLTFLRFILIPIIRVNALVKHSLLRTMHGLFLSLQ
jgi:hypothetical protein